MGRGVRQDRLAGACPLPDAQSFSSRGGNSVGKSGGGNEMVLGHLHRTLQPAAQAHLPMGQTAWKILVLPPDVQGSDQAPIFFDANTWNLC